MNMCLIFLYVMIDFFNNSYKFEQELDFLKSKECLKSAIENLPAFKETIKFIFDRCNGRSSEIPEKTIDDAFDCVINKRKSFIYSNQTLSHHEKERMILQIESSFQEIRDYFKSSGFVKWQFRSNSDIENNI